MSGGDLISPWNMDDDEMPPTFVGYVMKEDGDALDVEKEQEILIVGEKDERNKGLAAVMKEESEWQLDDSSMTGGDLISQWYMDNDKAHRRMTFVGYEVKKEGDALTVEEEHESLVLGVEDKPREETTVMIKPPCQVEI